MDIGKLTSDKPFPLKRVQLSESGYVLSIEFNDGAALSPEDIAQFIARYDKETMKLRDEIREERKNRFHVHSS